MGADVSCTNCSSREGIRLPLTSVPTELRAQLEEAQQRLAAGQAVVPCELLTCSQLHGNATGLARGFCCEQHRTQWHDSGIRKIKELGGDVEKNWDQLDADITMQYATAAGVQFPPFSWMKPQVQAAVDKQTVQYRAAIDNLPDSEQKALTKLKQDGPFWPTGLRPNELKERCLQPETAKSVPQSYASGLRCAERLYRFSAALAAAVESSNEVLYSVKRPMRLFKKTLEDFPAEFADSDFRHCADLYRTSVVLDTAAQLEEALKVLKGLGREASERSPAALLTLGLSEGDYVVERIKNRFCKPCVGYQDVLVNLRIDGYVVEVQLHLKVLYELKQGSGHRIFNWARRYIGVANRYEGERSADGKRHGRGTYYYASGDRYVGEFTDNKMSGQGVSYYMDGNRYEGMWKEGKMHGTGIFHLEDGERYEGDFKDNQRHGKGHVFYADGEFEAGSFRADKQSGAGIRWSGDRRLAWKLADGKVAGELSESDAQALATELGFEDVPPPSVGSK